MMDKIYIVAEIGCNHNGDPKIAKSMVTAAKKAGVDAVKFQTFKADLLISKYAPKAEYQIKTTGNEQSQLEMTRMLELSHEDYKSLRSYALSLGLDVFSTPFDFESIDFLSSLSQTVWKIPSGELLNLPYLEKIALLPIPDKKIILSTGMASLLEIDKSLSVLTSNGVNSKDITILHCNTEYPTPFEDVNLNAIRGLQKHFNQYQIGFSDHSPGYFAAIASVPYGVSFIEKHFTLDKDLPGPDHKASVSPDELTTLCQGIRAVELALGSHDKIVTNSERKNKIVARKSIVASCCIKKGEKFSLNNITTKRPGNGISPMHWYDVLGEIAEQDFSEDELIMHSLYPVQEL